MYFLERKNTQKDPLGLAGCFLLARCVSHLIIIIIIIIMFKEKWTERKNVQCKWQN